MEVVAGYVSHIVYRNEDNGYTVLQFMSEEKEVTCVGNFLFVNEGDHLELSGSYVSHAVYGEQFKVTSQTIKDPEDVIDFERYLSSGAIKGIGPALASRIVSKFKEQTFRIIEEQPERLAEIKGISNRKAREIAEQVEEKKEVRKAMILLQKLGISSNLSVKIFQHYGQDIFAVLEKNPYQIADHIPGVGFKTVDEIALRAGIHPDSDFRIRCCVLYVLQQAMMEGHVYLPDHILLDRVQQMLGIQVESFREHLLELSMEHKIMNRRCEGQEEVWVYLAQFYYMERNIARMLHDLNVACEVPEEKIVDRLTNIERQEQIHLDDKQRRAVVEAVKHGVFVLTGGPGTGKTTTINTMIRFFLAEGMDILLAAPTGRAAKRMTETTSFESQTIHRLLEVNGNPDDEATTGFNRNRENPLEAEVIIVDEMSMVDLPLFNALLQAIQVGTRLILVGDVNQLPSVGPGCVLRDIIHSERFEVVTLETIFRQASTSDIIVNAHKIHAGETIALDNKSKDFFFLKRYDADTIIRVMLTLIQDKLPSYVNSSPHEIQVMTPTRKGLLGVERLNKVLQMYLNPESRSKKEITQGERIFRVGDKVMQIKNNYQLEWHIRTRYGLSVDQGQGMFNGDIGFIRVINPMEEIVTVEYDEKRMVDYSYDQLIELEHAYAITIHKSQGSEYPAVVLPLLSGPRLLYNRNLLYTAVTRAKTCLTIVGSETVFYEMIQNKNEQNRFTSLKQCFQEV